MPNILSKHGFVRDAFNLAVVPEYQKVVLYHHPGGRLTHIIRQRQDGSYVSKMGSSYKIKFRDPLVLSGPKYGDPLEVYTRPKAQAKIILRKLLDTPIVDAGIPNPSFLNSLGISTLRDLVKQSKGELQEIVDRGALFPIQFALSLQGLALR